MKESTDDLFDVCEDEAAASQRRETENAERKRRALNDWNELLRTAFSSEEEQQQEEKEQQQKEPNSTSTTSKAEELETTNHLTITAEELEKLKSALQNPKLSNRERDEIQHKILSTTQNQSQKQQQQQQQITQQPIIKQTVPIVPTTHAPPQIIATTTEKEKGKEKLVEETTSTSATTEENKPKRGAIEPAAGFGILFACRGCRHCTEFIARKEGGSICRACGCELIDHIPDVEDDDEECDDDTSNDHAYDSEEDDISAIRDETEDEEDNDEKVM